MTSPSATRAAMRAVDAPFVFGLGLVGVGVAARVAWAAKGGALVLLVPPALVAVLVAAGTVRVWQDLRAAAEADRELAAFAGREGECSPSLVQLAKGVVDRAASTLPSICILVGLLGTFAGLFEALVGARELLGSAVDAAALRAIIGAPLSGLARAFGSSAAGIVGSIVLGAAEGRFQSAADAVAVRIESIEERLRAAAIGEEVRRAVTSSDELAQAQAAREARLEALLDRVARAVETHAAAHATYNQSVVGEVTRAAVRLDRVQAATEATQAAVRETGATAVASSSSLEAATRELASAQVASAVKIEAALRELAASSAASGASAVRVEEAVRSLGPAVAEATERSIAKASEAQRGALEALVSSQSQSLDRVTEAQASALAKVAEAQGAALAAMGASQTSGRAELAESHRAHAERVAEAQRAHEERAHAAQRAHEERLSANATALEAAVAALREHLGRAESTLAGAQDGLVTKVGTTLAEALEAWSRRDRERAEREDAERRARWDDDDARRAEWAGAEKLVLQAAMDVIAERLSAVGGVQSAIAESVDALAASQRELATRVAATGEGEVARLEAAGDRMRAALEGGAERVADTIVRQGGALVEALRAELAVSASAVEARAAELTSAAEGAASATGERVAALEAHVQAIGASAADVARAVETLAEVLRSVPLEATGSAAAATAAPSAASATSDEDRAAFVACLEEARRWFDATQTLQQRFLDEASQLRRGGAQP